MEFNEKLQQLRKQKGLTQEALAEALYVSRTAVSKWESGKGYPGIDTLKMLARFFGVTVDELLSEEAVLSIAREECREKKSRLCTLVFGLLDVSSIVLFFFPLFAQRSGGTVEAVSLLSMQGGSPLLRTLYFILVAGIMATGAATLLGNKFRGVFWHRAKHFLSLALSVMAVLLLIVSSQPYAAVLLLFVTGIKAFILVWRE